MQRGGAGDSIADDIQVTARTGPPLCGPILLPWPWLFVRDAELMARRP